MAPKVQKQKHKTSHKQAAAKRLQAAVLRQAHDLAVRKQAALAAAHARALLLKILARYGLGQAETICDLVMKMGGKNVDVQLKIKKDKVVACLAGCGPDGSTLEVDVTGITKSPHGICAVEFKSDGDSPKKPHSRILKFKSGGRQRPRPRSLAAGLMFGWISVGSLRLEAKYVTRGSARQDRRGWDRCLVLADPRAIAEAGYAATAALPLDDKYQVRRVKRMDTAAGAPGVAIYFYHMFPGTSVDWVHFECDLDVSPECLESTRKILARVDAHREGESVYETQARQASDEEFLREVQELLT